MARNLQTQVTQLLQQLNKGNDKALSELAPVIYQELRRIASGYLKKESGKYTLQTTDLVHEAYLRLVDEAYLSWENRVQFFAIAARAMRQFLIAYAKKQKAIKRGGTQINITLDENAVSNEEKSLQVLALDDALSQLEVYDERLGRIVELRYFAGLTIDETSKAMDISPATVKREWTTAKAWLASEMSF
ncbi:MAG: sigma-70 family RNA polymerase sigma factor [Calditrichaeota bacterium]|nr:MAG: RNA polymerase subunit sigma-70 [Calditrichota bacterium]MBL1205929.1 sigma-70 family RNA polymerase sigma factor [Calditrichota bacterium]NOG45757.1 sigma-70 family RNA polymerase sigma factor [Calditrichota bacterium]